MTDEEYEQFGYDQIYDALGLLIEKINKSVVLRSCYVEGDPVETIKRVVIMGLNRSGDNKWVYIQKVLGELDLAILFGFPPDDSVGTWDRYAKKVLSKMEPQHRQDKNKNRTLGFLFDGMLKAIPDDKLYIVHKDTKINRAELRYILQAITNKILTTYTKEKKSYCELARAYWDACADDYKKHTRREMTYHKLGKIVKLLHEYKLIFLTKRWSKGKQKSNRYSFGLNNLFMARLTK